MSVFVFVCASAPSTGRNELEDISLVDLPSPAAHAMFCVRVCVFSRVYKCEMFVQHVFVLRCLSIDTDLHIYYRYSIDTCLCY